MSISDIFVLPSNGYEGWGAVVNEAMSEGCCVIASVESGAGKSIIHDMENGLLFNSGDWNMLSEKILKIVSDEKLRVNISRCGQNHVNKIWSPEVAAKRFVTISKEILNNEKTTIFDQGPLMNLGNKKVCFLYNFAQHYRADIFKKLDENLDIDFFFGDKMADVKKLNYDIFKKKPIEINNIKIWNNFFWQKGVLSLIFKKDYNKYIIFGSYYFISTWFILIVNVFLNKKIYLWTHGFYGNENFLKSKIKKIFFNLSNGIFLYGNYSKDIMIKKGFNEKKLHVIYNSLSYDEQIFERNNLRNTNIYLDHFGNDFPVVLFIGRLTKEKKLNQLISAFEILLQIEVPVNLVIVGKGEEYEELKKISSNISKNTWFFGDCYLEKQKAELIYNAHVCVSPGNVGLTALDSLVYGTPVISHSNFTKQMPEFESIIEGKTGSFFEMDNVFDLVNKIKYWLLIKNNRDEIRKECYNLIEKKYNPLFQFDIIKKVINEEECIY